MNCRNYQLRDYTIEIDGATIERKAFLVCCSNGSQYGNNAFITPGADMQDGLLDIAIIEGSKVKQHARNCLGNVLLNVSATRNTWKCSKEKTFVIHRPQAEVANIDGNLMN